MEDSEIAHWGRLLHEARVHMRPVEQLTQTLKNFNRSDAYAIQEHQFLLRHAAGETPVGWKMGLTSESKRRQMNLDSPLYGFLTHRMKIENGSRFSIEKLIHPKIEPEVAFWIKDDLMERPTREQVLAACGGVAACLEILDSRYQHFQYFSMEDVIADNSSSSHFVLGPWRDDVHTLDLKVLNMQMSVNGEVAQRGISGDISGDPVQSVIALCALLNERGQTLKAGNIVLAGAATAAVELKPQMRIVLNVDGLEPVSVQTENCE